MGTNPGKNKSNIKSENRGTLFRYLVTNKRTSRIELSKISGLTKMTVTNIISEFLEKHYVTEVFDGHVRATRSNPVMLELSSDAPKIIGVLIRHNYIEVSLCTFDLKILKLKKQVLTAFDQDILIHTIREIIDPLVQSEHILGIGIGSIGPVDIHNGIILNPPDFCGLHNIPIVQILQKAYHIPVYLDYHYNCTALAEKYFGNGQNYDNYLFLGISEGLSLGIVLNSQLFSNYTGFASELGHLCVDISPEAMDDYENQSCLGHRIHPDAHDPAILHASIRTLAVALAGLCNVLNPQAIIVGDSKKQVSDDLLTLLSNEINRRIVIRDYHHIDVLRAQRTDHMETSSCAISVIQEVFQGNLMF